MKRKYFIGVCGNYGYSIGPYDGQSTKTRNITKVLKDEFGNNNVVQVNIENWKKQPVRTMFKCLWLLRSCENVVMMWANNSFRLLFPLFCFFKDVFHYKLYYPVIGGWLAEILSKKRFYLKMARKVDGIHCETKGLVNGLKNLGLHNAYYSPVFSMRQPISSDSFLSRLPLNGIYRFCTFSRVTKAKGISTAIEAILYLNKLSHSKLFCSLDIYGSLDESYRTELETLLLKGNGIICYKGKIKDNEVIETLSNYYGMLFPTYYHGEGFPATLVESFMAGLPVIASDWKYNSEIITNKKTGLIFSLDDDKSLVEAIQWSIENEQEFLQMREQCLNEAKKYSPKEALKALLEQLHLRCKER